MSRVSPNQPCPCGSHTKYKKCCAIYHRGAYAPDALRLMRSRYCAYAVGDSRYIIHTTHQDNPDYTTDTSSWRASIDSFTRDTDFLGLDIVEFVDGECEAFVTFVATLDSGVMREWSRFVKVDNRWLYESGQLG